MMIGILGDLFAFGPFMDWSQQHAVQAQAQWAAQQNTDANYNALLYAASLNYHPPAPPLQGMGGRLAIATR